MLARRNEYTHPLEGLDREFGRMLNRFRGSAELPGALGAYAVDVHEDPDHFYVEAELPGFTKEEVDITLEDGVLSIRGERKEAAQKPATDKVPLHVERRWARFERSFTLPAAVDESSVSARLADGILSITLNKREEVKPRKIQITATSSANATESNGNGNGHAQGQPSHSTKIETR